MTGPEGSSTCWTHFRRKLTTLLESSSRMGTLQTLSTMLLPHPHRKQQTQTAVIRNRKREVIPSAAGMSEDIRHVCSKFNIRVVLKSGWTLRSMLTKVKDTLPLGKLSNVVYRIPCSCGPLMCIVMFVHTSSLSP